MANDEVPDIGEERKKRQRKKAEGDGDKIPDVILYQSVCRAIFQGELGARFYVVRCDKGTYLVSAPNEDPNVVTIIEKDVLEVAIACYVRDKMALDAVRFTPQKIKDCARYWFLTTERISEPKPFLWPGEEGRGFARLPWEKKAGECPTWDKLMDRITNATAFCHWVGSLFFEDSDRQQYIFLLGDGNDGKGSITRVFSRLFGGACYSGQPPARGREMFWGYYALTGKRLVVFPDCNAVEFITGGYFKSLSGDDPVAVEIKGGAVYSLRPNAKYMFHSNKKPQISSQRSDLRRILFCTFKADAERVEGTSAEFEKALWDECGAFLYRCIVGYAEAYPERGVIANDENSVERIHELAASHDEEFQVIFETAFVVSPTFSLSPADYQYALGAHIREKSQRKEFTEWMERVHKVKNRSVRPKGEQPRRQYLGIALRYDQRKDGLVRDVD